MTKENELIFASNSAPPAGWTQEEWDVYLDGMVKQTRAKEAEAREDGSFDRKMHYGSHPWADDPDPAEKGGRHD